MTKKKKKIGKGTSAKVRKKAAQNRPAARKLATDSSPFVEIKDPQAIASIMAMLAPHGGMPFAPPPRTKWIDLHTKPIPMSWGPDRMRRLFKDEVGSEPERGQTLLFFNKPKDRLKLYFRDEEGDHLLERGLDRGGFLLPVGDGDAPFIKVPAKKLASIFRA